MIIRFFLYLLAFGLPWLIFLIKDNPGSAFIAFLMQATIIGWPFATIWAMKTVAEGKKHKRHKKKIDHKTQT